MKTIACLLVAALTVESAPTTPSPNECEWSDSLCRAERFSARAKAEKDPRRRAIAWNAACREFLAAHAKSGAVEELCAARRTCEASLATEGLAASVRSSLENARVRLEEREAAVGKPVCAKKATPKAAGGESPRVAKAAVAKRPAAEDEAAKDEAPPAWMVVSVGEREAPRGTERAEVELAGGEVEARKVAEADVSAPAREEERASGSSEPRLVKVEVDTVAEDAALLPVIRAAGVSPTEPRQARPGRGLLIAGGITLGVGLGLGGAAVWAGNRARSAYDEGVRLHEGVEGSPDAATRARDEELKAEYQRMGAVALVSGIAGGVALVTGAILTGVGGRRVRRVESGIQPAQGGLAVHVRF